MAGTLNFSKLGKRQKFCALALISGSMHLTFLIEFVCFRMGIMAGINVISVMFYGFATVMWAVKPEEPLHPKAWLAAIFSEIVLHAMVSTLMQGLQTGFYIFLITSIPVLAYSLFLFLDMDTFRKLTIIFGSISAAVLAFTILFVDHVGTIYQLSGIHQLTEDEIIVMRAINIAFNTVMSIGFTLLFYFEVKGMIDKLQASNDQLNYTATHDALTGLSNRYSLWDYFGELEKSGDKYCVIMGDLDDFKKINDTYGHECGDLVLKSVAGIMLDSVSENEIACRWGGEEMILMLRGDKEECFKRVSKIREQILRLGIKSDGRPVKVSMTFGFVDCAELNINPDSIDNHAAIDELISMADGRLYTGKRSGKNVIIAA